MKSRRNSEIDIDRTELLELLVKLCKTVEVSLASEEFREGFVEALKAISDEFELSMKDLGRAPDAIVRITNARTGEE